MFGRKSKKQEGQLAQDQQAGLAMTETQSSTDQAGPSPIDVNEVIPPPYQPVSPIEPAPARAAASATPPPNDASTTIQQPAPTAVPAPVSPHARAPVATADDHDHDHDHDGSPGAGRPQSPMAIKASPPQQQQGVTPLHMLREGVPALIDCPYCRRRAPTRVRQEDSSATMICGGVLCLICVCATCLPCLCHWFADCDHYCTNCGNRVAHIPHDSGVAQPLGPVVQVPSQYAPVPVPGAGYGQGQGQGQGAATLEKSTPAPAQYQ